MDAALAASIGPVSTPPPTRVVMIPSASGGIGHISRTAALARALRRIDPAVKVELLLDAERLRPFNIDATRRMGFTPRLLARRTRENRGAVVRACLEGADVVVDDCCRYLLPLRRVVPQLGWVTLAMYPPYAELFMDWPLIAMMDAVIWPYAPLVGLPEELEAVQDKVVQTGPFLETDGVPDRAAARAQLGLPTGDPLVSYAPRGFPFGPEFGHRALAGVYGAAEMLRRTGHPALRLVLLAVGDPAELRGIPGVPDPLPDWVDVKGVVTPAESLLYTSAVSVLVGEGTSTMHEGAALRTPLVLVPGPIPEITLLAQALDRAGAAQVLTVQQAVPDALAGAFRIALDDTPGRAAMLDRAHALVTGGGGAAAAARVVLEVAARRRAMAHAPAGALAGQAG